MNEELEAIKDGVSPLIWNLSSSQFGSVIDAINAAHDLGYRQGAAGECA